MEEIWKDIEGFNGHYQVSNLGRVRSRFKVMKPQTCGLERNYCKVGLWKDKKPKQYHIHRLVAKAFPEICGEWFDGCEVDHLDTNSLNNVATNLRVCTAKENHNNPLTKGHLSMSMKGKPYEWYAKNKKKVLCIETNVVYETVKECSENVHIDSSTIIKMCKHLRRHNGDEYRNKKGLHFEYV